MSTHPTVRRRGAVLIAVAVLGLAGPAAALAAQPAPGTPTASTAASEPAAPVAQCVVQDSRLVELSGLAADDEFRYAIGDGGRRLQVIVLRKDCTVQRVIAAAVDPFDVEDLALAADGQLWLADTGDNDQQRQTIALHVLSQDGAPRLYRLTYPDGPHDAEALLLDRDGVPYIITKQSFGSAGVYRPVGPLAEPGPTPLDLVTTVRFERTDTPGGPVGSVGSTMITGGATSADGRVVALRTYTDAYLFAVPDGDLVAALGGTPVRVPLADEPQGEAIAFEPDGTLLSASERADAGPQPIRAVPDAVALVATQEPTPTTDDAAATPQPAAPPASSGRGSLADWQAVLIAVIGAAAVIFVISLVARRSQAP